MIKFKDKKGVFGLNAVQSFFAIILGIALLAYVIVIIMGTLSEATILNQALGTEVNETPGFINNTGYTLSLSTTTGFANPTITALFNYTDGTSIGLGNASVSSLGVVTNATTSNWANVSISYTYNYDTTAQQNLDTVLTNTSTGVTSFFSSINPVYAILAVLVIILVLVVLVRVVQSPNSNRGDTPSL